MKSITALLTGLFLILGAQSILAYGGHYHTRSGMSEQEVISQVKTILPMIKNGTDKAALQLAQLSCGNTGATVKMSNPHAEIDQTWEENNGEFKESYFAHINFDVNCIGGSQGR